MNSVETPTDQTEALRVDLNKLAADSNQRCLGGLPLQSFELLA